MDNPKRFTDDDRAAILKCLGEEQALKQQGKPYRESVIVACEIILRLHPVEPLPVQRAYDYYGNHDEAIPAPPNYWWQNYD